MDGAFEPRVEDYRLLTGTGNFQDDEATTGAAWGVFVRSPHAFADIRRIDIASAQTAPGVLAVVTAAALDAAGIGSVSAPVPVPGSPGMVSPHRPSLARDCVRHVGDPVALVVARSEAEARDAAELVEIEYAARAAVTDVARATAPEGPQIWPEAPGNIAVDWHPYGAKPEDRAELDRIFASAAHIASVRLVNQRIVMAPMEPRTGVAVYEPETDRYALQVASQSAFAMRQHVARTMGVPVDKLRVVSRDVGGAFGMRTSGYPEYPAMLLATKMLGRPVRWLSTRQEGIPYRQPGARHHHRGPPRDRCRRQVPRPRRRQYRSARRLPHLARRFYRDREFRALPAVHVRHPCGGSAHQMRFHQHGADRALSRRGAPRGELLP